MMNSEIDVSFVIPCLNGEKTLSRCIESILNQKTIVHFEVLVIDNNSSDHSVEVASRHPIQLFIENKTGRSHARNLGIEKARGKWIAFVDCDVILDENWLTEILTTVDHPWLDAGQGPVVPKEIRPSLFEKYRLKLIKSQTKSIFCHLWASINSHPSINTAACIYRRNVLLKVRGFDPIFKSMEDSDLCLRVFYYGGSFAVSEKALAFVYWDRGGWLSYLRRFWHIGLASRIFSMKWDFFPKPMGLQFKFGDACPWFNLLEIIRVNVIIIASWSSLLTNRNEMNSDSYFNRTPLLRKDLPIRFPLLAGKGGVDLGLSPYVRMVWFPGGVAIYNLSFKSVIRLYTEEAKSIHSFLNDGYLDDHILQKIESFFLSTYLSKSLVDQ